MRKALARHPDTAYGEAHEISVDHEKGFDPMERERATYDIAEAGRLLGIGRNQAYEAVKRGEIPIIKIGRRLLVPKVAFDRILDGAKGAS
jgi:excisionase family DNA binding protein